MPDYLDILAKNALRTIEEWYYETATKTEASAVGFKEALLRCEKAPIISEIKFASPTTRAFRRLDDVNIGEIARNMQEGGATCISVLTEPKHFGGNIGFISQVRDQVKIPILMKDIVLSPKQIEAGYQTGANAILLIQTLFDRGYCQKDVQNMIDYSHSRGLEVLLEVHTEEEFLSALHTDADMIGINNRNLKTLQVDLGVTRRILTKHNIEKKVIVSESGINSSQDIRFLRICGAYAFLVGTAIMKASNIEERTRELVEAL